MKYLGSIILAAAFIFVIAGAANAQETDLQVIDEGVVQVNDTVITLSMINREVNNTIESLVGQGEDRAKITAEVEGKRGQIIAALIEEELIMQKGKEIGLEREVEARINERFVQQMKDNNLKSLQELEAAMRSVGVDPEDVRAALRSQIMREWVFGSQVDEGIRWNISAADLKEYYAQHEDKFKKPATVTLSEIFLSFAGKDEEAVKKQAEQLVARIRGGEDFAALAVQFSDRPSAATDKGVIGTVDVNKIEGEFAAPLKDLKKGEVTDPIRLDIGMEILRVDERTEAGTSANFDENAVLMAMLQERVPPARKEYIKLLKEEAYIKISEAYRPIVSPFLYNETADETTASN